MGDFFIIIKPSAVWTAENPSMPPNYLGVESLIVDGVETETNKAKLFNGIDAWNDLDYWSPAGSGAGTVTSVSSANGSATVATGTTTPVITIVSAPKLLLTSPQSADNTYQGSVVTGLVNSGGVTQWDAVYLDSSSHWVKADANGSGTFPARGVATTTQLTTVAVDVMTYGMVRHDAWTWTPGGTIYLSGTAGGLTQTAPSASADNVQAVGYAIDADTAFFDFNSTYVTLT